MNETDEQLVYQWQQHSDSVACAKLLDRYRGYAEHWSCHYAGRADRIDDLRQEALLAMFRCISLHEAGRESLRGRLWRSARGGAIDAVRRMGVNRYNHKTTREIVDSRALEDRRVFLDRDEHRIETIDELSLVLSGLRPRDSRMLISVDGCEESVQTVADREGVTYGSARVLLTRARRRARQLYEGIQS